jgi:thymidylate kinase
MIIIVEGIDRIGKTTLCKRISEHLGYPIFKDSFLLSTKLDKNAKHTISEKLLTTINLLNSLGEEANIVVDRFYLTELVYGCAERNYLNHFTLVVENDLKKLNAVLILMHPTNIEMSSKEHGKDLSKHEKDFVNQYESVRLTKFQCNYDTMQLAIDWLDKQLEMRK